MARAKFTETLFLWPYFYTIFTNEFLQLMTSWRWTNGFLNETRSTYSKRYDKSDLLKQDSRDVVGESFEFAFVLGKVVGVDQLTRQAEEHF